MMLLIVTSPMVSVCISSCLRPCPTAWVNGKSRERPHGGLRRRRGCDSEGQERVGSVPSTIAECGRPGA
jgi:hypothetical protein